MKVETYALKASTGKHIRMATRVLFPDGQEVKFMEKLPKREAVRQARARMFRERLRTLAPTDGVPAWLLNANPAFGGRTPWDLIKAGDFDPLFEMLDRMEAGEPV